MRAVIQRVARARVTVGGRTTGDIADGLLVYLGVRATDSATDAEWTAAKLATLRIFPDEAGRFERSLAAGGSVLLVSQFTLYGDVRRGRRPAFTEAAPPDVAAPLIQAVAVALRGRGLHVEEGEFGAHMEVESVNDGPVTILLDSADRDRPRRG